MLDIIGLLRDENDYEKIEIEANQLGSTTTQFKLIAPDGKKRTANVFDYDGIIELAKNFPSKKANRFIEWFTYSDETIDGKSKSKACALFDSSLLDRIERPFHKLCMILYNAF